MELLSVVIITYNEAEVISRCIRSVQAVADEIIVLDSFSNDRTVEIARNCGARIFQQRFSGYVGQKNAALSLATHNYVLSLDADEMLSPELAAAILVTKKKFRFGGYKMNRKPFYCGKFITHGSWYPEPKLRLFDKRLMNWGGLDPHDRVIQPAGMPVARLKGDIIHFICDSIPEHQMRSENFSSISAKSMFAAGKKTNWLKIVSSPTWFFLSDYIFRGGFLSGWRGWKIATIQTRYHFEKYRKLYRLQNQEKAINDA